MTDPLLTLQVQEAMCAAARAGETELECSLNLDYSRTVVSVGMTQWSWQDRHFPYVKNCKARTIYYWADGAFQPVSRFGASLIKLVPTEWGPPTFEIDGIKMLPTAHLSPYADAARKVDLIQPRDKVILDTCGGLGYFAAWCMQGGAKRIISYEKNPDVLWLRRLNPWSPAEGNRLTVTQGDISEQIVQLDAASVDAILHDPPRFGIAGELYSQDFYAHLSRVLKRKGILFHYTGTPNKLTSGRNVPNEVAKRLRKAGFETKLEGDGVVGTKR